MRDEKFHHLHSRGDAVLLLSESVALVWKEDVLDGYVAALQVLHDLKQQHDVHDNRAHGRPLSNVDEYSRVCHVAVEFGRGITPTDYS